MGTQLVPVDLRPVNVPFFPGFYYSDLADGVDREEELTVEWLTDGDDDRFCGKSAEALADALYWTTDYSQAYREIARDYADALADEVGLHARFDGMDSPREYNFATDRVYLAVTPATLRAWLQEVDLALLTKAAEERHTSCSGFISFYSPDWADWGPVTGWDHNQAGTLFLAWLETRGELEGMHERVYERLHDYNCFGDALAVAQDLDAAAERLAAG